MIDDFDTRELKLVGLGLSLETEDSLSPLDTIKKQQRGYRSIGKMKARCLTLTPKPLWNNEEGSQPLMLLFQVLS